MVFMADPVIRPALVDDRAQWSKLFRDYGATGNVAVDDQIVDRVWTWILDPTAQTRCCVAQYDGQLLGFVHYCELERPILGDMTGYVDDLYVAPAGRGHHLGLMLLEHVLAIGAERGWSIARWTTKQGNAAANHLYQTIARRAPVNVYVADTTTSVAPH